MTVSDSISYSSEHEIMDRWYIFGGGEKQISGRSVNMNRSELPHSHTNDDEEQLCVLCSLSAAWLDFSESVRKKILHFQKSTWNRWQVWKINVRLKQLGLQFSPRSSYIIYTRENTQLCMWKPDLSKLVLSKFWKYSQPKPTQLFTHG